MTILSSFKATFRGYFKLTLTYSTFIHSFMHSFIHFLTLSPHSVPTLITILSPIPCLQLSSLMAPCLFTHNALCTVQSLLLRPLAAATCTRIIYNIILTPCSHTFVRKKLGHISREPEIKEKRHFNYMASGLF